MLRLLSLVLGISIALSGALLGTRKNDHLPRNVWLHPQVKVHFYQVTGSNLREVKQSIREHGPKDLLGFNRDAVVSWSLYWDWPQNAQGDGQFDKIQVKFSIDVTLPSWDGLDYASESEQRHWNQYLEKIKLHEAGHILGFLSQVNLLESQFRSAWNFGQLRNPADVENIGQLALSRMREIDREYDKATDHGATQGARLVLN